MRLGLKVDDSGQDGDLQPLDGSREPLYNLFDLTPQGRGGFPPQLSYR
jgi:hypothetical protein